MNDDNSAITRGSADTQRQGFGETSVERRGETSATALEAYAKAQVNARFIMALQRPRNNDVVRVKLLQECERPGFAQRAFFSLPRGNKPGRLTGRPNCIEGLTVRFAEAAIRLSTNIDQGTKTIYDDDFKRMINVSATDLETNTQYSRELVLDKTVERSSPKDKAVILGSRTNSAGNVVYIVQATEDELLQKEGSLISKTFRTLALRLVPADVLEECEQQIIETWKKKDAQDPDASRKKLCDAFFALGVTPAALAEYLGHDLEQLTSSERMELGGLYSAIKESEITWADAFAERVASRGKTGATAEPTYGSKSGAKVIADRIAANKAKSEAAAAAKKNEPAHDPQTGEVKS